MPATRFSLLVCLLFTQPLSAAAPPVFRYDSEGVALPGGAVARVGAMHPRQAGLVAFTAGGKEVLTFVPNRGLFRWEVATGRLLAMIDDAKLRGVIPDLWFVARDGKFAVEVLLDTIRIIDTATGKVRHELIGDPRRVVAVAISHNGALLASSGTTGAVRLYDVAKGRIVRRIFTIFETASVDWMAFTPDARSLVTGTGWAQVDLWDVATGDHKGSLTAVKPVPPGRVEPLRMRAQVSPAGDTLYVICADQVQVWDLYGKKHEGAFAARIDWPTSGDARVSLSFDGRLLARLDPGGKLELWETASGKRLHSFAEIGRAAAFAPTGWSLANGRAADNSVPVWEMRELFLSLPSPLAGKETLQSLWEELADSDPSRAHRALWRLAGMRGVEKFLGARLPQMPKLTPARLKTLLDDLISDNLATRQKAERELARVAETSRDVLANAAKQSKDFEQRLRLNRLLKSAQTANAVRELRAVMVLEACGTAEARKVLEQLAGGLAAAKLTREARATLSRMAAKR
jgi:hypothetical protein